ncbi:MAG: alpha/beta hydrolase fold domain-containing protein [Pseudomonadota bacterium]
MIGESAGGNLSLALLQRALREKLPLPDCVALMSPWCDLTAEGAPTPNADGSDPTLTRELIDNAAAMFAGSFARETPEISPIFADWPAGLPPMLITTGTRDLLRDQVLRLVDRIRANGNACDLRVHPHMWHVFEFYDEIPEADRSLREIGAFLKP